MPTETSSLTSNGDLDHSTKILPAFTVLQKDGLDSSLPLLHINGHTESNGTGNPDVPKNGFYARKLISRSNEHLVLASLQSSRTSPLKKKSQSRSQESLSSLERAPTVKSSMTLSTEDFNEVLNAKLRRIQERQEFDQSRRSGSRRNQLPSPPRRKPFITTVKTGEFLLPPPEVAALLGIAPHPETDTKEQICPLRSRFKPLLSLAKRPEVRHSSHNARCPAALKATVDFTLGMINATTMAASTSSERSNLAARNSADTKLPQVMRALPKKLWASKASAIRLPMLGGEQPVPFANLMFDRRVVRGSTYSMAPPLIDGDHSAAARQAEARRRHLAKKRGQLQATRAVCRSGSPPPVPGRKHEPIQTELFLEELFEKPDEFAVATQTDYFLDRPATPVECPVKIGQDACTQIDDGELFDFDTEVQPILEKLVGKTMEQAWTEVMEEEEVAAIQEQQRRFKELRDAEEAEAKRLAEQERRLREEKDMRLREHELALKAQRENEDRVAASVMLTGYIAELLPSVLQNLKMAGFLLDDIKTDVEGGFMPWLMKEVKREVGNVVQSRELLMEIITEILRNRAEIYKKLGEEYDASRERKPTEVAGAADEGGEAEGGTNFSSYDTPDIATSDDA